MNTSRALTLFLALALFGLLFLALSAPTARAADPVIVRVTTSGTTTWPCGNQSNWSNPCALQTALSNTVSGSELWVAAGTYTPTMGVTRTVSFHLVDGVALYGGFAGGETAHTQRNFSTNLTILSGDLDGDDDISNVRYDEPTRAENAYHVVTGSKTGSTAILDGLTVTGGNADGLDYPDYYGGGMFNSDSSPTLTNVTFISNTAYSGGGGMYNEAGDPTVTNVTFISNTAIIGGGMYNNGGSPMLTNVTFSTNLASYGGGGMYDQSNSNPTLTNVTFTNNLAYYEGGGMYNNGASPTLSNVTFSGNSTGGYGGGMDNYLSSPTLSNVTFISNTANGRGGGMYNDTSTLVLTNVTFSGNSAYSGGGTGGGMENRTSNLVLTNVTFSGNSAWVGGGMRDALSNSTLNNVAFIGNTATGTGAYGGMGSAGGSATLTNVTFSGNSASYGGGLGNETKAMTLTNVTFSGNTAIYTGGGMQNLEGIATLTNVTFSGNSAGQNGGGMHNWASSEGISSNVTIRNAIFWGNTAPSDSQIGNDATSTASLSDSVVEGGCPATNTTCTHILASDPLLGALGNYGGATQTIRLLPGSSSIDAGNNAICPPTDQRGKPRVGACDSGAFEFQGYTVAKPSGDQQSTRVNTPFANPLQVSLTEIESGLLTPGIVLAFSTPSSGASAAWSGSLVVTATTNASGVATVAPPTANGIAGSYAVTASAAGLYPSATFALTNFKYDTTIVVTSSANPSISGQSVIFTAVVSGVSPSGSVAFKDGGAVLAGCSNVALSSSTAQCTVASLTVGSHAITGAYSGDADNNASTSAVYMQNVGLLYDYLPLIRR